MDDFISLAPPKRKQKRRRQGRQARTAAARALLARRARGLEYPDSSGERVTSGVAPNELTASEDRDWLAGTPWHKHVRARIEAVEAST